MSGNRVVSQIVTAVKLLLLAGIVYWLWSRFPKDQWDILVAQEKNWWLLLQGFVLVLTAILISFWRWMLMVQSLGVPMRLWEAFRLGFLGQLLNQVSIGSIGGDLFKAIEAARRSDGKRTEIVASVLVDRALGLLGLLIVAALVLVFVSGLSPILSGIRWFAVLASLVGLGGLVGIVVLGSKLPTERLRRLPMIGQHAERFVDACMIFQGRPRLLAEMVISSVAIHALLTLSCVLISHSLYDETPTVVQHFMAIPPAVAAATIPITPGGLGVQEAIIEALFKEIPEVPRGFSPLIMAIFFRGLMFSTTLIGAVYYFVGIGSKSTRSSVGA